MVLECIPEYEKAGEWAEISSKYGLNFEYNEFFNPEILEDKARTKERYEERYHARSVS